MKWINGVAIPVFKKVIEENTCYKIYSKIVIWVCRVAQNSSWQKHKTDSERDVHAQIEHFALNY